MESSIAKGRSVLLIANHMQSDIDFPVKLTGSVEMRRPNEGELSAIRDLIYRSGGYYDAPWLPYESIVTTCETGGCQASRSENPEKWKYWVVCDSDGVSARKFESTMRLHEPSLELSVGVTYYTLPNNDVTFGFTPPPLHVLERYMQPHKALTQPLIFDLQMVENLKNLNALQCNLDQEHNFVKDAISIFDDLHRMSDLSSLKVIGYFSVIEAMVTHSPRLMETLDSISHQIRGKMILLNKRFSAPIDFAEYFGAASPEKLWSKLYAYRSKIAHGSNPSFDGDLAVLRSRKSVHDYLELVCKRLLVLGLKDAEFLKDLREC